MVLVDSSEKISESRTVNMKWPFHSQFPNPLMSVSNESQYPKDVHGSSDAVEYLDELILSRVTH